MLKDSNNCVHDFAEHPYCDINLNPIEAIDGEIYGADEFRMFAYKIRRCTRTRTHDWTDCPYAHRGEKAQRRDPRRIPYCAIACPAFRNGRCYKGDSCEFAHGVFEYWLHPARYRTRACNAGRFCQRKVCFFAHTPEQLRAESKIRCNFAYRGRMHGGVCHHHHHQNHQNHFTAGSTCSSGSGSGSSTTTKDHHFVTSSAMTMMNMPEYMMSSVTSPISTVNSSANNSDDQINCFDGVSEFLKSIKAMKIRDDNNKAKSGVVGFEVSDSDLPNIEWISDLVQ
ncbi:hypothetical protein CUMW_165710 [Citrus unshiu]|uniref:C3H1-type domain-containing protein n=1 Tax=Citrus unshiu TaxID=55188 RepID=A0A2H5PTG0_CITUN|nr:hypothetical protein CUMW_165710 [Citrus unshiu]